MKKLIGVLMATILAACVCICVTGCEKKLTTEEQLQVDQYQKEIASLTEDINKAEAWLEEAEKALEAEDFSVMSSPRSKISVSEMWDLDKYPRHHDSAVRSLQQTIDNEKKNIDINNNRITNAQDKIDIIKGTKKV